MDELAILARQVKYVVAVIVLDLSYLPAESGLNFNCHEHNYLQRSPDELAWRAEEYLGQLGDWYFVHGTVDAGCRHDFSGWD